MQSIPNATELSIAADVTTTMAARGFDMTLVVSDFQQYPLKLGASLVSALHGMLQAPTFFMPRNGAMNATLPSS
jgi:hypothetical protein